MGHREDRKAETFEKIEKLSRDFLDEVLKTSENYQKVANILWRSYFRTIHIHTDDTKVERARLNTEEYKNKSREGDILRDLHDEVLSDRYLTIGVLSEKAKGLSKDSAEYKSIQETLRRVRMGIDFRECKICNQFNWYCDCQKEHASEV